MSYLEGRDVLLTASKDKKARMWIPPITWDKYEKKLGIGESAYPTKEAEEFEHPPAEFPDYFNHEKKLPELSKKDQYSGGSGSKPSSGSPDYDEFEESFIQIKPRKLVKSTEEDENYSRSSVIHVKEIKMPRPSQSSSESSSNSSMSSESEGEGDARENGTKRKKVKKRGNLRGRRRRGAKEEISGSEESGEELEESEKGSTRAKEEFGKNKKIGDARLKNGTKMKKRTNIGVERHQKNVFDDSDESESGTDDNDNSSESF